MKTPMTVTGWCNTGHHETKEKKPGECPKDVKLWDDKIRTCTCSCHSGVVPVEAAKQERAKCIACGGEFALRKNGTLRNHKVNGVTCLGSEG
jgi:hypothetical protein